VSDKHSPAARFRRSALLLLLVVIGSHPLRAQEATAPAAERYLEQLRVERQESWLAAQLRQLRSYPHLDRAFRDIERGRLAEARAELERYLELDPRDLRARFSYLVLLYRLHDHDAVLREASAILEDRPGFVPARLYRGMAAQTVRDFELAASDFRAVYRLEGADQASRELALGLHADLALRLESFVEAEEALEGLATVARVDFSLAYRRGLALEGQHRLQEAEGAYVRASVLAATPEDRIRALEALAESAKRREAWGVARRALEQALEITPDDPSLLRSLAQIAFEERSFGESAYFMRQVVALTAEVADRDRLANTLLMAGEREAAVRELEALLESAQSPELARRTLLSLGHAYSSLDQLESAVEAFAKAVELQHGPELLAAHYHLGVLHARLERPEVALKHLETAVRGRLSADVRRDAHEQLGHLYHQLSRHAEAEAAFLMAVEGHEQPGRLYRALGENARRTEQLDKAVSYWHRAVADGDLGSRPALALALAETGRSDEAIEIYRQIIGDASAGASGDEQAELLERIGTLHSRLERHLEAAQAFSKVIELGLGGARVRTSLGLALFGLERWAEARDSFLGALEIEHDPRSLLYVGRCYEKLGKPGLAIHYLEQALAERSRLPERELEPLLDALGFHYFGEAAYARAIDCWSQSLSRAVDPEIPLRLGMAQRRLLRLDAARRALEGVPEGTLRQELEALRLDELAAIEVAEDNHEAALELQHRAREVAPSPERSYRLGLTHRSLGQAEQALSELERAVAGDPTNTRYAEALGYQYLEVGDPEPAIELFEGVVARDPDYLRLPEDLGYLYQRQARNRRAVDWFKRAIDNRPFHPAASAPQRRALEAHIWGLRREVSKLSNRFDLDAYLVARSDGLPRSVTRGGLGGGVLPSQAGVALAFQPPGIGFRSERIFQIFGRVLSNLSADGLEPVGRSLQGGVGVRYKPFRSQILFLTAERLFKIGADSENNWLLRGELSLARGESVRPGRSQWGFTNLYLDAGYFAKEPRRWAYYSELRQGLTFRLGERFLVTPHLIADGRWQHPTTQRSSYAEWGAGVSLRLMLNERRYQVADSSLELTVHYKVGKFLDSGRRLAGHTFGGLVVSTSFHF